MNVSPSRGASRRKRRPPPRRAGCTGALVLFHSIWRSHRIRGVAWCQGAICNTFTNQIAGRQAPPSLHAEVGVGGSRARSNATAGSRLARWHRAPTLPHEVGSLYVGVCRGDAGSTVRTHRGLRGLWPGVLAGRSPTAQRTVAAHARVRPQPGCCRMPDAVAVVARLRGTVPPHTNKSSRHAALHRHPDDGARCWVGCEPLS